MKIQNPRIVKVKWYVSSVFTRDGSLIVSFPNERYDTIRYDTIHMGISIFYFLGISIFWLKRARASHALRFFSKSFFYCMRSVFVLKVSVCKIANFESQNTQCAPKFLKHV